MSAYSERERDIAYLGWVRTQPCLLAHLGGCEGAVEADHAGGRPYGQKSADNASVPLCTKHHRDRTESRGFFRGRTRDERRQRREWLDRAIAVMRDRYANSSYPSWF